MLATYTQVWPCFSYHVLAMYIYMYCCLILIACSCKIIMEKNYFIAIANSSR